MSRTRPVHHYTCLCTYPHTCPNARLHTCSHTCLHYVCTHTCLYTCLRSCHHTCPRSCLHAFLHTWSTAQEDGDEVSSVRRKDSSKKRSRQGSRARHQRFREGDRVCRPCGEDLFGLRPFSESGLGFANIHPAPKLRLGRKAMGGWMPLSRKAMGGWMAEN